VKQTCIGKNKNFGYKLYLINVDAKDSAKYKKDFPKLKSINFSQLETAEKKSCIVVEDIIHITKRDEQQLRTGINYQAHHKTQKFICASHAIYKTQVYSLLGFFNFIIFTSSIANVPTLRNVFNYFKVSKSEIEKWIEIFKSVGNGKLDVYFYFDCEENLPIKNEAVSVFSIIANCVNPQYIKKQDLSITFMSKTGEKKHVSLVDYVISMLTPDALVKPPLIAIHRFVKKFCNIPNIFVKNKSFEK